MPISPEVLLISSVITKRDYKTALATGITSEHFLEYSAEWQWIDDYFKKYRQSPGRVAFKQHFQDFRVKKLDEGTNTSYYCDEVKQKYARHQLLQVMNDMAELVSEGDLDQAVKVASTSIISIAASLGTEGDSDIFSDYHDILRDVESRVERYKQHGSAGIPSGFDNFDALTGGFNPGDFCIVSARLGHSKSWQLQKMAAYAATAGYNVVFDALEQTRSQASMRIHTLMSASAGEEVFRNTALMQGKDFDLKAYKQFLIKLKREIPGRLHVGDATRGRISPMNIAAQIERHQPDIVFIDYLTLMQASGPDWQGVKQLSNDMKALASRYSIPIVAAAQLNRDGATGKELPGAEAIAFSDAIGQDADAVITMRQISHSVVKMKLVKNRNGTGNISWYVEFNPGEGIIRECTYDRAMDLMDADKDITDAEEVR